MSLGLEARVGILAQGFPQSELEWATKAWLAWGIVAARRNVAPPGNLGRTRAVFPGVIARVVNDPGPRRKSTLQPAGRVAGPSRSEASARVSSWKCSLMCAPLTLALYPRKRAVATRPLLLGLF